MRFTGENNMNRSFVSYGENYIYIYIYIHILYIYIYVYYMFRICFLCKASWLSRPPGANIHKNTTCESREVTF